jgi:hypothetical protein
LKNASSPLSLLLEASLSESEKAQHFLKKESTTSHFNKFDCPKQPGKDVQIFKKILPRQRHVWLLLNFPFLLLNDGPSLELMDHGSE